MNYTLIPPIRANIKKYYLEPHFEVGTVNFIIYFSDRSLSCTFKFYDGDILFDTIEKHYIPSLTYTLEIPESRPSIIRMEVSNYNHEYPYFLYMYNKNYKIPLTISNFYLYTLFLDIDLSIVASLIFWSKNYMVFNYRPFPSFLY